jgi:hypothetical protein
MVALLVVALALGLNNSGAAIAIGVSGVDRLTGLKFAAVFGLRDVVMPAAGLLIGHGLAGELGRSARLTGAGVLAATAVWGLVEAVRGAPQVWQEWRLLVSGAALSLDDFANDGSATTDHSASTLPMPTGTGSWYLAARFAITMSDRSPSSASRITPKEVAATVQNPAAPASTPPARYRVPSIRQTWHVITSAFPAGHAAQAPAVPDSCLVVPLPHC